MPDDDRPSGRLPRGGITTTGAGSVRVAPDVVVVQLGAEVAHADPGLALAEASAALGAVRDALLAAGVDRDDVRTSATSSWTDPSVPRTTVTLGLEVRLRDLASADRVLAAAVAAAGPAGRLHGTAFEVSDAAQAVSAARELAFRQAVDSAGQLADLAGRPLGPVLDVREERDDVIPVAMGRMAAKDSAGGVPLEPGATEVRVVLVVRHAWAEPA
ncbi:MAG: hypothetical protein JWP95_1752 [Actinotalea sp.]|nr:hypothetical protein [Actinotalea sp.]